MLYSDVVKVSSTLNRDTKQFGKKFLFDGREETCWNSDQVEFDISDLSRGLLSIIFCRAVLSGSL